MECCQAAGCFYFALEEPCKHDPALCMAVCCIAVQVKVHVCCQDLWQLVLGDMEFGKAELMPGDHCNHTAAAFAPLSHAAARRLFDTAADVASGGVPGALGSGMHSWRLRPCANMPRAISIGYWCG